MSTLNYWQRQQQQPGRRGGSGTGLKRRPVADPRVDTLGRPYGKNRDGIPYSVCPYCSKRSMVRYPGQDFWTCESCKYMDNEERALV